MRRLESRDVGLTLEWDEATEQVALAQVCGALEDRERAYGRLTALQRILRGAGVSWMDTELTERHRRICGATGMMLVWRAEMRTDGGARAVARVVAGALGAVELYNDLTD